MNDIENKIRQLIDSVNETRTVLKGTIHDSFK